MNEAQRRFKIVGKPEALPGCCFTCGGSDRPWFADLAAEAKWEHLGAAYLCSLCFTEIALMVDYVPVEDAETVKKHLHELKQFGVDHLMGELEDVSRRIGDSLSMLSGVRDFLTPDASVISEADGSLDALNDSADDPVSEGEDGSSEPSSEQGLADVHSGESESDSGEFKFGF